MRPGSGGLKKGLKELKILNPFRPFLSPLTQARTMLSWGPDLIVIVYVPRACTKKNFESISPIILDLGNILLVFGHFEPIQAVFEPPDPGPGSAKLGAGSNCHCMCP